MKYNVNLRVTLSALIVVLALSGPLRANLFVGRATVIDGDTLDIHGELVRLQGVDTPEVRQLCRDANCRLYRCGQQAANALAARIGASPISCEPVNTDQYGRTVAVRYLGTLYLNGWLVEEGLGLDYRRYSRAYAPEEAVAQRAARGICFGTFIEPWEWRRQVRSDTIQRNGDGPIPPLEACDSPGGLPPTNQP